MKSSAAPLAALAARCGLAVGLTSGPGSDADQMRGAAKKTAATRPK